MRKLGAISTEEMKIEFRFGKRVMVARQIKHNSRACQARERPGRKVYCTLGVGLKTLSIITNRDGNFIILSLFTYLPHCL